MRIYDFCTGEVTFISGQQFICDATRLMSKHHSGSIDEGGRFGLLAHERDARS